MNLRERNAGRLDLQSSPPSWVSSGVFILCGILIPSGIVVLVAERCWPASKRAIRTTNSQLLTVANIAVLYTVLLAFIAVAAWEDLSKASDIAGTEAGLVQDLYVPTRKG